jgi:hypothetical protein
MVLIVVVGAGCTTHVTSVGVDHPPDAAPLPRPDKILVADFSIEPGAVHLDNSPGVLVQRQTQGITDQGAAALDAQDVQGALSDTLVQKLQAMGFVAERVAAGTQPGPRELAVTGQVTAIHEGSRARRTVVGFGAGKSYVQGQAELLRGTPGGVEWLQTYRLDANSGRMPGMGIGAAAGGAQAAGTAISGSLHVAGEMRRTPAGREAAHLADDLSTRLGQYFVAQHWISGSASSAGQEPWRTGSAANQSEYPRQD